MQIESALSFSEVYDDNIFSSEMNKEKDLISNISPRVRFGYEWPLISASIHYTGELEVYGKNSNLNRYNQDGSIDLNLDRLINRFNKRASLNFTERFVITPDLPNYDLGPESEMDEGEGIQFERTIAFRNKFGAFYKYLLSRRSSVSLNYSNILTEYRNPELVDRIEQNIEGDISYQLNYRNTLELGASYKNISFDGEDSSDIYLGTVGWNHNFSPNLSFQINGGILHLSAQGKIENRFFLSGKIDKAILIERDIKMNLYYRNDYTTSGLTNSILQSHIAGFGISKLFTQQFTSFVRGSYGYSKSVQGEDVRVELLKFNVGFRYLFYKWLSGNISYSFTDQNSKGTLGSDFRRNRVHLNLTTFFQL